MDNVNQTDSALEVMRAASEAGTDLDSRGGPMSTATAFALGWKAGERVRGGTVPLRSQTMNSLADDFTMQLATLLQAAEAKLCRSWHTR